MNALTTQEKLKQLRHISIFSETDEDILYELAGSMTEREVMKGAVIVKKGDPGDAMYIITHGSVRVHDGNHVLARLDQGSVFGEYSLIDDDPRSATVTAEAPCQLLCLDKNDFYDLAVKNTNILHGVLKVLIRRMRDMNVLEEKLSRSYLKIRKQKDQIEKQNDSINSQKELLYQQNFDLTKLNEEKNQILSMVIHQIKNPLTSSLCVLEVFESNQGLSEEQLEGIDIIMKSLWRINNLINETLNVSSIESKVFELKSEPLDLHTIVNDLVTNYTFLINQKELSLETDIKPVKATLNLVYFTQIADNLISNAIKFTPNGKRIRIKLDEENGKVMLRVQDEGPGIPEDLKESIFHQYNRQTEMQMQNLPPVGLGLAIVHKYTLAMKGKITVEDCPDTGGTCFTVELPKELS